MIKDTETPRIFEINGQEKTHVVDFSTPSCTCKDWIKYHIPCKHFLAVSLQVSGMELDEITAVIPRFTILKS